MKHVAADEEAYNLYTDSVKLIHDLVDSGIKAPSHLDSLDSFVAEMDVSRARDKAIQARNTVRETREFH